MKKFLLVIPVLFFLLSCAGQSTPEDNFDASVCNRIPVGPEKLAAIDPNNEQFHISCADLARCTSIMGWSAPPDVPCQ